MKKVLINEAFRLQQIAGLRPINEIGDYNTLDTLGAYEDENGKTVVSDLIKNEKFIEDKLRKVGISSSKEYDQDVHGQKIVIFTIEAEGMSRGLQKETSLSEQEDPGFEALIDDLILKIAQNYAEEGEDVEDYMGVAAEDAVELIRRKYRV